MGIFGKKYEQCSECTEKFQKHNELLDHGQTAHNLTLIKCPICHKSFLNNKSRIEHTEEHKVSIGLQIGNMLLGLIIPFAWIYPFYKIQKLRYGFLIIVGLTVLVFLPLFIPQFMESENFFIIFIIFILRVPVIFYFLIKWSREWNKKIVAQVESLSRESKQE